MLEKEALAFSKNVCEIVPAKLGDSIGDIARRYDFTESKVKNMLHHTRTKLKDFLIKEGIEI